MCLSGNKEIRSAHRCLDVAAKAAEGRRSRYPLAGLPASEGTQTLWHQLPKPSSASAKAGEMPCSTQFHFHSDIPRSNYWERVEEEQRGPDLGKDEIYRET